MTAGFSYIGFTDVEVSRIACEAGSIMFENPFLTEEQAWERACDRLDLTPHNEGDEP